eukprot:TRINITY_DN5781_c0_g1_i2.p1 TRINITY_DN5781_c0_g1~~TRINITY_DN5781_c0_g1_i2.p1  ORF type:complete len:366 (+),score=52.10 TRINITY_DN5781_c0_g1_i2:54-1100(+)
MDEDIREVLKWCIVVVGALACSWGVSHGVLWARRWWVDGELEIEGYIVTKEILGRGGYGVVRRAVDLLWGKEHIAVKMGNRIGKDASVLKRMRNAVGFAEIKFNSPGVVGMQLLGPSLESLKKMMAAKVLSLKTVLLIADQAIERLHALHLRSVIHRDVKPENLLFGTNDNRNTLYLVDFGISEKYYDSASAQHIPYREGRTVYGTPYFSSINADAGCEQSRRDDLESLGYTLVYLLKGTLPWVGLRSQGPLQTWHSRLIALKKSTSPQDLCTGLPPEFAKYLMYCRELRFTDAPQYQYLRGIFHRRYAKMGFAADGKYDWSEVGSSWKCWTHGGPAGGDIAVEREDT